VKTTINYLLCIAAGLVIYAVYTLDRLSDERFQGSNRTVGLSVSIVAYVVGFCIFWDEGLHATALLPFIIGYLYNKKIKIGKHSLRLKGSFGIKNLVVGTTWGIFIAASAGFSNLVSFLLIFILYALKSFINSTLSDFKDIKGDTLAGIKILPVSLGAQGTRNLLLSLFVVSHLILGVAMFYGC
jgi:4-hydroxybenzoate polyprenyltransferase